MKIFEFHPDTGKKGTFIEDRPRATWGSGKGQENSTSRAIYERLVSQCRMPKSDSNIQWTLHLSAGIWAPNKGDISYNYTNYWVCFCVGLMNAGYDNHWDWFILPSSNAIYTANLAVATEQREADHA